MLDLALATQKIAAFEGFRADPYRDSIGKPTIGYGTIRYPNGTLVTMADAAITQDTALAYLQSDLRDTAHHLANLFTRQPTMNQWSAMLSLAYNIGAHGFQNSSVLRKFNGGDIPGSADAFLMWDKATVDGRLVEIPGLLNRRQAEKELFLST